MTADPATINTTASIRDAAIIMTRGHSGTCQSPAAPASLACSTSPISAAPSSGRAPSRRNKPSQHPSRSCTWCRARCMVWPSGREWFQAAAWSSPTVLAAARPSCRWPDPLPAGTDARQRRRPGRS
jgi:hypothetical protein